MLQIMNAILKDPSDNTKISLIYANQTEGDILVKDQLDTLMRENPDRLNIEYTLDRPPSGWTGAEGFITEDMIKANLPGPEVDPLILMCGPPPMIKFACRANLDKMGYNKARYLEF